ncbi:MAG: hypothetical protein ACKOKG_01290 [Verrucomicrobiota bacterium]
MNPPSPRLQQTQGQDLEAHQRQVQQAEGLRDFESPEALIAWDRSQTPVPESLRSRVVASLARTEGSATHSTDASKPWWRRLF